MAPSSLGAVPWWIGVLVGVVGILFPFIVNWRKGKVDESAMVLSKWKELVESHERQISAMRDEVQSLRNRLNQAEEKISDQANEILQLREENAGLKRAIAQSAESSALVLGNHISGDLARRSAEARKGRKMDDPE